MEILFFRHFTQLPIQHNFKINPFYQYILNDTTTNVSIKITVSFIFQNFSCLPTVHIL